MLAVGAIYYMLFTGVPGTATYYATIMTIYTWVAKGAWFALGYPYDFITVPIWIPSAMLLDLTYWATRRNKHAAIIIGGTLVGLSIPLFNMVNLLLIRDPLEIAFKYPRPTLASIYDPYRTSGRQVLQQSCRFGFRGRSSADGSDSCVRCKAQHVDIPLDGRVE